MVQQKSAVIWHLSFMPTNLVLFEPLSSIVQEDEGTIVTPVRSQLNTSCGEISSTVIVSTADCKKGFLSLAKSATVYLLFKVGALRHTKSILFRSKYAQCLLISLAKSSTIVLQNTLYSTNLHSGQNISTSLLHVFI